MKAIGGAGIMCLLCAVALGSETVSNATVTAGADGHVCHWWQRKLTCAVAGASGGAVIAAGAVAGAPLLVGWVAGVSAAGPLTGGLLAGAQTAAAGGAAGAGLAAGTTWAWVQGFAMMTVSGAAAVKGAIGGAVAGLGIAYLDICSCHR
ncbi:hypothetical protein T492DRAFT_501370 [Pavlovales sp. CCMP2436]|nr:hypothetical protein T492DRAFT_501370 [Pavlovales sp. CCMP2436]|mmetsp:Transcript_19282/g.45400  ORF Transcript_19282/g.45400 Transcript_19282/m.45400 type:complete len:149 (+) Transcript_19282:95-541(+)